MGMIERPCGIVCMALVSEFVVHRKLVGAMYLDLLPDLLPSYDHIMEWAPEKDIRCLHVVGDVLNIGMVIAAMPYKARSELLRVMDPEMKS